VEVNGIAHIQLSVRRFEQCRAFYERLMPFFADGAPFNAATDY
jgi:catechol 2,3-dioxygenase-like lactoylglutathione lyase family enzyme